MKRVLSVSPARWRFVSRQFASLFGATVALLVLVRLQERIGVTWPFVAAGAAILAVVASLIVIDERLRRTLKHVAADERYLYVADHVGAADVAIPLGEIVRVTQWRGRSVRPVTVHLRSPLGSARRIRFLPTFERGVAWQEDAIVRQLRRLARLPD